MYNRHWIASSLALLAMTGTASAATELNTAPAEPVPPAEVQSVPAPAPENDFLLVPGVRAGIITKDSSKAKLEAMGAATAKEEHEDGESLVTTLYPGTDDEIKVFWADKDEKFVSPDSVCIYQRGEKLSKWHTAENLKIGMSLQELEDISGGPVAFSGFHWTYGGRVVDGLPVAALVTLAPKPGAKVDTRYEGEGVTLESGNPGLQHLGIHVEEICIALGS